MHLFICFTVTEFTTDLSPIINALSKIIPFICCRYSTVFLDPKTGNFVHSNRIIELFPEREGSPDHWFFNDQVEEPTGTNTVPRSASVPSPKELQSFVSFIYKLTM